MMPKWMMALIGMFVIAGWTSQACAQMNVVGIEKQIKLGLNFANIGGDDADDTSTKTGLVGGFGVKLSLAGIIAVQSELLYTKKGATVDTGAEEIDATYDYLEIPVMGKINMPGIPNFYAGPALGFKLNAEADGDDIGDTVKSTDFSLVIGSDYGVPIPTIGRAILDLRYTFGLSSFDDSGADLDTKHRVFSVMLGFGF